MADQEVTNTSGYGERNETPVPASEVDRAPAPVNPQEAVDLQQIVRDNIAANAVAQDAQPVNDVDLQQIVRDNIAANEVNQDAQPVDPQVAQDLENGSGETVAVPASEIKYSAEDLDKLAAANGVDAGGTDIEVGITDAQLFEAEGEARSQSEVIVGTNDARDQETNTNLSQQPRNTDWRVVLRLAPGATYLYNAADAGLLAPLKVTNGVIFPYTPTIATAYKANYSAYDLTHSNYRGYFYQNSYTDQITLTAEFTAQSTSDAAYVLAVIHFFRSVTKMFYGQDAQRGSPPPLVFLSGLGDYQFNNHPCLVSSFNYNLPADVDYISSGNPANSGLNLQPLQNLYSTTLNAVSPTVNRLAAAFLPPGAQNALPAPLQSLLANPTYVPSKIIISLTLLPVQSRQQVSKQFSLKGFANGQLLKGGFW